MQQVYTLISHSLTSLIVIIIIIIIIIIITFNYMYLDPSWEAVNRSATPELFQHFMEHEGSLPCSQGSSIVPILSKINPVHTSSYYLFKIHFL
jgi:hypothetical protein